jgi:hypothetical protein
MGAPGYSEVTPDRNNGKPLKIVVGRFASINNRATDDDYDGDYDD